MKEPLSINRETIRDVGLRIGVRDFVWLRGTVNFALTTPYALREFILSSVEKSHDPYVSRERIRAAVDRLSDDDIIWMCDNFKRPELATKRRSARKRERLGRNSKRRRAT